MSKRPVRRQHHPPLDLGFFQKCRALAKKRPRVAQQVDRLLEAAGTASAIQDPFQSPSASLEQYFADVYYEAAQGDQTQLRAYVALARLYNLVICETTNWLASGQGGALDAFLRVLLKTSAGQLTIVTFNHDLVIENSLHRIKSAGPWCLESLYGDPPFEGMLWPARNRPQFQHHNEECTHKPPARVLKLHGSLNWGFRCTTKQPSRSALFPGANRRAFVHSGRLVVPEGTLRTRTAGGRGRERWYWWPLVIPPIYEKGRLANMEMMKKIWSLAAEAIRTAERLIIVGYSLPEADVQARQMIRQAVFANKGLDSVTCIDPRTAVVAKVEERLDCSHILFYRSLVSFLKLETQKAA